MPRSPSVCGVQTSLMGSGGPWTKGAVSSTQTLRGTLELGSALGITRCCHHQLGHHQLQRYSAGEQGIPKGYPRTGCLSIKPGTGGPEHWSPGKGAILAHPDGHRERRRVHGPEHLLPLISVAPAKKPHSQANPNDHTGTCWPWAVEQRSRHLPLHSCTQRSSHSI